MGMFVKATLEKYRSHLVKLRPVLQAIAHQHVTLEAMRLAVPGPLPYRLAAVMGNLRMQRLFDHLLQPGMTVIDVGANIGYNTCYAARCVGPNGRVYALEPAQDTLAVLYRNLFTNHLENVCVLPYAAGGHRRVQRFFLRGAISAVNSLFPDNFYAAVTEQVEVLTLPLDDLMLSSPPDLVKIDVEGAEIDVLQGMSRLMTAPGLRLIVEWHPTLQETAGYAPTALPRYLLERKWRLHAVSHLGCTRLSVTELPALTKRLLQKRSPVELLAVR